MRAKGREVAGETNRDEGLLDLPWASASIWLLLWACWAYGIFHVIPTVAVIYAQKNVPLTRPTASVVNLAAIVRLPWIAVPVGIAAIGWIYFLVSRSRKHVRLFAWTANILLFVAGVGTLVALLWEIIE
jgi:type II secretory pathway component PulF